MRIASVASVRGEIRQKVMQRACEIAGGAEVLSARLDVERHALEFWLSGRATPPEHVLLVAMDIVLQDDITRATQDRRKDVVQRSLGRLTTAG